MLQHNSEPPQRTARAAPSDECLIKIKQLREHLGGCSEMHVWRLLNDARHKHLAFPAPIKINGRNHWRMGQIRRWVADQAVRQEAVKPTPMVLCKDASPPRGTLNRG